MRLQNHWMVFHFSWKFIKHIDSYPVKYLKCIIRNSRKIPKAYTNTYIHKHTHIYVRVRIYGWRLAIRSFVCIKTKLCDFSLSHTHILSFSVSLVTFTFSYKSFSKYALMYAYLDSVHYIYFWPPHTINSDGSIIWPTCACVGVCLHTNSKRRKKYPKSKLMCSKFCE